MESYASSYFDLFPDKHDASQSQYQSIATVNPTRKPLSSQPQYEHVATVGPTRKPIGLTRKPVGSQPRSQSDTTVLPTRKSLSTQPQYDLPTTSCPTQRSSGSNENDRDNPRNWSQKKKVAISCFTLLACFVANLGTPIYIAAIPEVQEAFQITTTQAISPVSLYAYGLAIGALVATAACEVYGRRIVFRITIPMVFVFTIVGGCSQNFATLAVARFLAGFFSGPSLTVGIGILNDIWDVILEKTGTAFGVLFALFVIWGTEIGPMASASIVLHHSWRWTFWVTAILVWITTICCFLIPETYHTQIIRSRAEKMGEALPPRAANISIFLVAIGRPLHMMIVEPIVFPTGLVLAVTQAVGFEYFVGYALLFEKVYGFSQFKVGMAFGPLVVGSLLAVPVLALFDKLTYQKARTESLSLGKTIAPEMRLYPAMLSSITLPLSLFWLAWTGRKEVHYIVPILSGALFGFSYFMNFICLSLYNNDVYTIRYGASVIAAHAFLRFIVSASFPLFTVQMINRLGFAWATSLIGFVTVALIPVPWVFFKWGPKLRKGTRYLKQLEINGA